MTPTDKFLQMWHDQMEFNSELRQAPLSLDAKQEATRDMVLHLMSECHDLLDAIEWKRHRRSNEPFNPARVRIELIDIFKMWMTVAQIWESSPGALFDTYWDKSAVVRQRHAEEFLRDSRKPCAVIDLDNTLADFSVGMACWLRDKGHVGPTVFKHLIEQRPWINGAAVGIADDAQWNDIKHGFYTSGGFRTLPLTPFAVEFARWCRTRGWNVVILTSRPIDRYPNVLTDTMFWLLKYGIHADFIWWGGDKSEKLRHYDALRHVQLAVDDDPLFVEQFTHAGIRTFWYAPHLSEETIPERWDDTLHVGEQIRVPSLARIMEVVDGVQ